MQLKDFLTLYNKVTELCFNRCVDNLSQRELFDQEVSGGVIYMDIYLLTVCNYYLFICIEHLCGQVCYKICALQSEYDEIIR